MGSEDRERAGWHLLSSKLDPDAFRGAACLFAGGFDGMVTCEGDAHAAFSVDLGLSEQSELRIGFLQCFGQIAE